MLISISASDDERTLFSCAGSIILSQNHFSFSTVSLKLQIPKTLKISLPNFNLRQTEQDVYFYLLNGCVAGVCGYKRIIRSQTSFLFVLPTGPFLTAEVCGRDLDCASDESSDESTTYKQWNRVKKHACLSVCSFVCPSSCTRIYSLAQTGEKNIQKAHNFIYPCCEYYSEKMETELFFQYLK